MLVTDKFMDIDICKKCGNESGLYPKNCKMWQLTYFSPSPVDYGL